jgi:hypothetical protein
MFIRVSILLASSFLFRKKNFFFSSVTVKLGAVAGKFIQASLIFKNMAVVPPLIYPTLAALSEGIKLTSTTCEEQGYFITVDEERKLCSIDTCFIFKTLVASLNLFSSSSTTTLSSVDTSCRLKSSCSAKSLPCSSSSSVII